jgi:hypothetical protein
VNTLIANLATACPRECLFNNSMPEDLFADYTCAGGPCPACSSSLEFGEACKAGCSAFALAADEEDMKCLLKFSFHEIHRIWEMKEYLGYLGEQCSDAYDENELTAGAFSSTDTTAKSMVMPLSVQQTGTTGKILKVRASCTLENVMENDADARMFFDGAAPWAVTAEDIQGSMIAVTEAASTMLKESNAMMQASMEEQAESGLLPEADGALLADKLATVFESKMGSCSEGHECSSAEAEATSVPPPAAIFAYVNALGGPGGVIVPTIESSLDTGAFGSSECLVICSDYDPTGVDGTCEPVDYEKMGKDVKSMQSKQKQLSAFMYSIGADMVKEKLCGMDTMHRQLRGRPLQRKQNPTGRQLGGAAVASGPGSCDGAGLKCLYQPCGGNATLSDGNMTIAECGEGTCQGGMCMPGMGDMDCAAIMDEFEEASNNCSTLVVIDGIAEGFACLHKYINGLYGDCVHVPNPDMEECGHSKMVGEEIIHEFEHAIEVMKTKPADLVDKMMEKMATDASFFGKMQERLLEMAMPIWLETEASTADKYLDGSDEHVIMEMCDKLTSTSRTTNGHLDQECTLYEAKACLTMPSGNASYLGDLNSDAKEQMFFCARAYMDFYPADDGIFQTCLEESAAKAGGPMQCVLGELDPTVAAYLEMGDEALEGTFTDPVHGVDVTHNMEDAMIAATMDPAEKIEANVEMATYTYLRRLHEETKKQRRLQGDAADCLTINGKEYCTKGSRNLQSIEPDVPASNGKITNVHKFFTRKHKARKVRRAHKSLMRRHRQLSRR